MVPSSEITPSHNGNVVTVTFHISLLGRNGMRAANGGPETRE
jgi:hypothetical protein